MRITPSFDYFLNDVLKLLEIFLVGKIDPDQDANNEGQKHTEKNHMSNSTIIKVSVNIFIIIKFILGSSMKTTPVLGFP